MGTEIERRWLLPSIPQEWLEAAGCQEILQGYLIAEEERSLRVRRKDDEFTMTTKAGSGLSRQEDEQCIDAALFEMLWPLTESCRIEKRRYSLKREGRLYEIDIFAGTLAPLRILEVEFPDLTSAAEFDPPDFVGRELTDDGRFTNAALSRDGLPAGWEKDWEQMPI